MRPFIIGIGGTHSGSGKTTYASLILKRLSGWGAIKYSRTELYCSLTDDMEVLMEEGKDTRRMLDSGAERVLWVQSPPSELGDILPAAVDRLSDMKGIVVEGNSAIEFLGPDIIIFILGSDSEKTKKNVEGILRRADIVINGGSNEITVTSNKFRNKHVAGESEDSLPVTRHPSLDEEGLLRYIEGMVEIKEKIRSSLKDNSVRGKIPCPIARRIAEELNVHYGEVGKVANELDIKITDCELGCF